MREITPTPEQASALSVINHWLEDKDSMTFSLKGYAGTGKTTILDFVVKQAEELNLSVLVTATTNKAVKVLKEKIECNNFSTIHSALNMKLRRKGTKEWFEPIDYKIPEIQGYDLVIVDECSMIGRDLLGFINKYKSSYAKILYCGDPAQLQPVEEDGLSESFNQMNTILLEDIVRYGSEIELATSTVRESNKEIDLNTIVNGKEIRFLAKEDLKEFIGFRKDSDRIRYLTFTNNKVMELNKRLRNIDYEGANIPKFLVGDRIIANELCKSDENSILLNNSEEGDITEVIERPDAYQLRVQGDESGEAIVNVVIDEYKQVLDDQLQKLIEAKKWKEYYGLKESYHDIRHCYAMTTHKSQGSTYETVIVDIEDFNKCRDIKQRNQLLYVAMTRASKQVIFKV